MIKLRKLKVLVFEDHIDTVLRALGETGSAHLIDMREKNDTWEGTLAPYEIPHRVAEQLTNLRSRISSANLKIDTLLKPIEGEQQEASPKKIIILKKPSDEGLNEVEQQLSTIEQQLSGEEKRWTEMQDKLKKNLVTLKQTLQREESIIEAKSHFLQTDSTVYFEAYVPTQQIDRVIARIRDASNDDCLIVDEPPSHREKVPTIKKSVPSYLMAFENLTLASGYPSSWEVNPTSIMAITFPLLFGIMFADVGQGIIFAILGAILTYLRRKVKLSEIGDIVRYLLISGELFILLGISAIFFGFLFGEFFGPSGVIHPISLGKLGPFYFGGFEPTHEPMKMLKFSLFVGVAHISLGIVLRIVNELKHRHYKLVPIPICWLWLLWGGLFMWAYWGGISNISKWFAEGIIMLGGLVILPLILIILFTGIAEGYMEGIGFGVEVFAETLSHTLSYGRLMALGLVHSVLNSLFLVLGGVEHGHFPLQSIPLIALGTVLVMVIEGLIVFVHTLRLHWIEWFSKFYTGEGIPFKPFTQQNTD